MSTFAPSQDPGTPQMEIGGGRTQGAICSVCGKHYYGHFYGGRCYATVEGAHAQRSRLDGEANDRWYRRRAR